MDIRPGINVNIIVNIDHMREVVDVKNSMIHDVSGKTVIVAQTDPPISRTRKGTEMYVTFLEKESGETKRYGFTVKVSEFITDYELTSSQKVQAVVMKRVSEPEEYNLRMFYRLEPPSDCGIGIFVEGKKVNILDISLGGAKISHEKIYPFKVKENVKMQIEVDEKQYEVEAVTLRIWEPENEKYRKSLSMVSVQFLDVEAQFKNVLARKIRDVERDMRYKDVYTK